MQYALLGNTGLLVSRLCLGAMSFRNQDDRHASVAKVRGRDADAMVGAALEAGINFFDTADVYSGGESESMLGTALKGRRADAIIATKVGMHSGAALTRGGLSRRHILWSVDESLKRLATDWIDVYIVHREDALTPLEETLSALDEIVRTGKVRYIGFSNWSAWRASAAMTMQKANGWAPFTHGQMYYSLLCRDIEQDMIPMLQSHKAGLTVWSPLSGGFLSGKYTRDNLRDPDNRRGGFDFPPLDLDQGFALLDRMGPMAERHGATVSQVALAWLLANPAVTSVIVGASRLEQFTANVGALGVELDAAELDALNGLTAPHPRYPNWFDDMVSSGSMQAALSRGKGQG
ncbi:MAG TPA: aldo/keto reductase [Porticoccaceae bacterium]